jgi:hypothetical protein
MSGKTVSRDAKGRFLTGHAVMGGRPIGARNRLATQFSDDLYKKWKRYGPGTLDTFGKAAINGDIAAAKAFVGAVSGHLPREAVARVYSVNMAANPEAIFQAAYDMALEMANGTAPKMI